MSKSVQVCLSFDFDAISVWAGPRRSRSPNLIARGEFGAVGAERLLGLLTSLSLPSTWFMPGHTIETYPDICRRIADAGHEIGYHGYCHEAPSSRREPDRELAILERGMACVESICGRTPVGHRLPGGNLGERWVRMLLDQGFSYDSSMAPHDFAPTWHRLGDRVQTDGPHLFGDAVDLVILPFDWNMDDWPYFSYEPESGRPGLRSPDDVLSIWKAEFDYLYHRIGSGVYVLTLHPQCIGKGSRMLMLEVLVDHMNGHEGVTFATLENVAETFRQSQPARASRALADRP